MREKKYAIPLAPVPLQRARHNGHHFYDPQQRTKVAMGLYFSNLHGKDPKFEGPLLVEALFYLPIPKEKKERYHPLYHWRRPDLDNFVKFVLDAITNTGSIWHDDCQVTELITKKHYAKIPHIEILIRELV